MKPFVTAKVADDGTVTIPRDLLKELGFQSHDEIEFVVKDKALLIHKPRDPEEVQEQWDRVKQLLREGLAGADWEETERNRVDRCF